MNVLSTGLPFGTDETPAKLFHSNSGHTVRTLSIDRDTDYLFKANETVTQVFDRISGEWTPDALICWLPELFPPPLEVEKAPVKTVAIVSDWNIYHSQLVHNLSRYDLVLTDKLGSESLKLYGATPQYIGPIYSQRSPVHRKMDVEKDIDILFAGNLNHAIHRKRGHLLEKIAGLSDRFKIVISNGYVDDQYAHLLNRARIVFNCSVRKEMNLRCFEALACGSLQFLEDNNLEVGEYLQDREEVVLYNEENLVNLIEYYLNHEDEAEKIASQGHAKASNLAGENRLDTFFNWIEKQSRGTREYSKLNVDQQVFAEIMQYASSLVLDQQNYSIKLINQAARKFPNNPEFLVAAANISLVKIKTATKAGRKKVSQTVLQYLQKACSIHPEASTLWLNLAFICNRAGSIEPERHCLENALAATSCRYGELLFGNIANPYYALWRRKLGMGERPLEILHAMAALRLARINMTLGELDKAQDMVFKAIKLQPDVSTPYRLLAEIEMLSGNPKKAAGILAESLHLTAFDEKHRTALIKALKESGNDDKAKKCAEESARIFSACEGSEETVRLQFMQW